MDNLSVESENHIFPLELQELCPLNMQKSVNTGMYHLYSMTDSNQTQATLNIWTIYPRYLSNSNIIIFSHDYLEL